MFLIEAPLAAWRLSRMLVREGGPFMVFHRLRVKTGIEYGFDGVAVSWPDWNPLHCMICTSIYTAVLTVFLPRPVRQFLAVSALAVLIEEVCAAAQVHAQE